MLDIMHLYLCVTMVSLLCIFLKEVHRLQVTNALTYSYNATGLLVKKGSLWLNQTTSNHIWLCGSEKC